MAHEYAGPPVGSAGQSTGNSGVLRFLGASDHVAGAPMRILDPPGIRSYRAYGVPWIKDDIHERVKDMTPEEIQLQRGPATAVSNGIFARWNGSFYYPSKIPDLIGVKNRKYLDATGTHLNRGIGDLMRYTALVSFAESSDFGQYHMLTSEQKKIEARLPDEGLYALALYIQSLEPPPNPNAINEQRQPEKDL
jgi:hypothetical protein